MNGGFSTGYFAISRGVRQGDPLSPYLFILCLEALLSHIRLNKDIKGIPVEMVEIKLSAFADDLTLFLKDVASARRTFTLIEEFSILSGLKMNKSKCEALWLGQTKTEKTFLLTSDGSKPSKSWEFRFHIMKRKFFLKISRKL